MAITNITYKNRLDDKLLERILSKLCLKSFPPLNLKGLETVYAAWCRSIPFDNIRKLIHLESENPALLPGHNPVDFFEGWLRYGTGGTCWAGSDALFTFIYSLGFKVYRGVATMLLAPNLPPNHGTVIVKFNDKHFLVDSSMLHNTPMCIDPETHSEIKHPAWGIEGDVHRGKYHIRWRPLHMLDGCACRVDRIGAGREKFLQYNEKTRIWGPFNYSLYVRVNRDVSVLGVAFGFKVMIDAEGNIERYQIGEAERRQFLIEELGINQNIVKQLPLDKPTPRPPPI